MSDRARLRGGLTLSLGALLFSLPLSQLFAEAPPWADSARAWPQHMDTDHVLDRPVHPEEVRFRTDCWTA